MDSTTDALVNGVADAPAPAPMGNNSSPTQEQSQLDRNQCLADLCLTDPRNDKIRIEKTQGGLHRPSYKWILDHPDFQKWQEDYDTRLLWIKSDAGQGKTMLLAGIINELSQSRKSEGLMRNTVNTISRSVREVALRQTCAPTMPFFFCQGSDGRLNHATAVLRGIMYLLLCQQPTLISHIQDLYEHGGPQVFEGNGALDVLAHALTRMLCDDRAKACCIIIDALDECLVGLPHLLEFIVQISKLSEVKWIVSSRDSEMIEGAFFRMDSKAWLNIELNARVVSLGTSAYINYKLRHLKPVKCKRRVRERIGLEIHDKADGNFLWVALVVQQLQSVRSSNVKRVLNVLPIGAVPMYDRVMARIEVLDEEERRLCHSVLSLVTTAYRPLTLSELGMLSGITDVVHDDDVSSISDSFYDGVPTVEGVVNNCAPLLTIYDNHVYLTHKSVKDYLNDTSTGGQSKASPSAHYDMFSTSVHIMSKVLSRDIYGLRRPDTLISNISRPKVDPFASIRYSCLHWVDHLQDALSDEDPNAIDVICNSVMIYTFLAKKYLHWLEALSLLREIPRAVMILGQLHTMLERRVMENVSDLVQDAHRFILANERIIEMAPLQVYESALILDPGSSLIAGVFENEAPKWISSRKSIDITPSVSSETLDGYSASLLSACFSKDGQRIASVSCQNIVKIWDVATGECQQKIEETDQKFTCVAFSADEQYIALGSDFYEDIKIWDVATNTCSRSLDELGIKPTSISLSEDGKWIAIGSYSGGIIICDAHTGAQSHKMVVPAKVSSVAFSPDGKIVASTSEDSTIRIWDAETGKCIYELMLSRVAHSVTFDQTSSSRLLTDLGTLDLDLLPRRKKSAVKVRARSLKFDGCGMGTNGIWVAKEGADMLRLPNDSQAVVAVGAGEKMAISCGLSSLLVLEFGSGNTDN